MELVDSLKPLFWFSRLFGLGSFVEETENGKGHLIPSPHLKFYSIIVFIIVFVFQFFIFEDRSGTTALASSRTADLIDTYGFFLTCMLSFLVQNALNDEICSAVNQILELEKKISIDKKVLKFGYRFICYDIVSATIYEILFVIESIFVAPYDYLNYFYYVLENVTYVFLELFSFGINLQFCHLVWMNKRLLNVVNEKIVRYIRAHEIRKISDDDVKADGERTTGLLLLSWKPNRKDEISDSVILFKTLSVHYGDICDICSVLNNLYAIQNLLNIALCFIELTYGLYSAIYTSSDAQAFDLFTVIALWSGYFFYKLVMILFLCTTTTKEAKKTAQYINQVLEITENKNLRYELELFSLQLIHQEISFQAFGFFPLDLTLLYSMLGAVTGYLIILVQFQYSSASQASKNCSSVKSYLT